MFFEPRLYDMSGSVLLMQWYHNAIERVNCRWWQAVLKLRLSEVNVPLDTSWVMLETIFSLVWWPTYIAKALKEDVYGSHPDSCHNTYNTRKCKQWQVKSESKSSRFLASPSPLISSPNPAKSSSTNSDTYNSCQKTWLLMCNINTTETHFLLNI